MSNSSAILHNYFLTLIQFQFYTLIHVKFADQSSFVPKWNFIFIQTNFRSNNDKVQSSLTSVISTIGKKFFVWTDYDLRWYTSVLVEWPEDESC
jgi:hypothetical protein